MSVTYFSYSIDKVLIGVTWGDIALGYYDRACRFMLIPIVQITIPFTRVAVPLLSRLIDDAERYRAAYFRAIRLPPCRRSRSPSCLRAL